MPGCYPVNFMSPSQCLYMLAQLCPTLFDSIDWRLPDSSVHGILQARILEWVAISFSISGSLSLLVLIGKYFGNKFIKIFPFIYHFYSI